MARLIDTFYYACFTNKQLFSRRRVIATIGKGEFLPTETDKSGQYEEGDHKSER